MSKHMKVTLTLPIEVAEQLRAVCHARGETASVVVGRWVLDHDERGEAFTMLERNTRKAREIVLSDPRGLN